MGLQACVECPFKLFKAQSGVFFSCDLKMGIRGHSFFFPGSPFPLFLLALTLTNFHHLSLSLMLYRSFSWSHAATYVHARGCKKQSSCVYTWAHRQSHTVTRTYMHMPRTRTHTETLTWPFFLPCSVLYCVCHDIVHSLSVFPCIWIPSDLLISCKDVMRYCSSCNLLWCGNNNSWQRGFSVSGEANGRQGGSEDAVKI